MESCEYGGIKYKMRNPNHDWTTVNQNNVRTMDLFQFFDEGQRAYRLKRSTKDCPNFDLEIYKKAWKSGFKLALRGFGLKDGFQQFLYEIEKE